MSGRSLAPVGPMGYVVCPNAVSPIELDSGTVEPPIALPAPGSSASGNVVITAAANGRQAFVVAGRSGADGTVHNELIPIDLTTQRAGRPRPLPGNGPSRAVVPSGNGQLVLVAIGSDIIAVDPRTGALGKVLHLGPGHLIAGLVPAATGSTVFALVPGGVIPVDVASSHIGALIPTGLAISSIDAPHGMALTPDGGTLMVIGQGGPALGGRIVPISTSSLVSGPGGSFDAFGIADPSAVAVTPDGTTAVVADAANGWLLNVPTRSLAAPPPPVRLPVSAGTLDLGHPTDVVMGPGATGAFVVAGLDAVLPYNPTSGHFGAPIGVCAGATSMTVAPSPSS